MSSKVRTRIAPLLSKRRGQSSFGSRKQLSRMKSLRPWRSAPRAWTSVPMSRRPRR